jgi:prevent-host-death family protein
LKYSEAIKPISYLKAHASEVIRDIVDNGKTMVITQNGEAKVVVQDVRVYEQTQESMALLKILAMSNKNVREGKFKPPDQTFDELEKRMKAYSES